MAKIIGFDKSLYKKFTCRNCAAIVEYAPNEEKYVWFGPIGSSVRVKSIKCPNCKTFWQINAIAK